MFAQLNAIEGNMNCSEICKSIYKRPPEDVAFCPYRVCPVGAHVDHNKGKITGFALDRGIHIVYRPQMNERLKLVLQDLTDPAGYVVLSCVLRMESFFYLNLGSIEKKLGYRRILALYIFR